MCVPIVMGSQPPALPWHVSCPTRCVCQIKPWFSLDSVYHEAPTVDCNDLLLTKLPSPIPLDTHTLHLQSNLLSVLDTAVHVRTITNRFSLPSLLSLHLEENHLTHLPEASFASLPALQELFLSHNYLHSIAPGAFIGLDSLFRLHINNNRLTTVNPQWFKLSRLESLMLNSNSLSALHQHIMLSLPNLQEVSLHSNPLRCDCLFHWAAKEVSHPQKDAEADAKTPRVVRFIQPQATLCSEPPELRARRVRDVSSGEISLPSFVGVREGGKLVLHCRALADPQPELYWVTPSGLKLHPEPMHASKASSAPLPCKISLHLFTQNIIHFFNKATQYCIYIQ
uniref:Leucine-rich repeat neuronal protein 2-like n=1 Tax=Pundamilia nyererei TaxID=303518 RepID=A0A3B4GS01_9CICH